jgi:quercetin dioxygenase-like cupin family protein
MTWAADVSLFVDALAASIEHGRPEPADAAFVAQLSARLGAAGPSAAPAEPRRIEACAHLGPALAALDPAPEPLRRLGAAIAALEPRLAWSRRAYDGPEAERFAASHANAMIVRSAQTGMVVGLSLMAPHTAYPEHTHPPDELYLVLSEGEWRRDGGDWFSPGVGGTVRNAPGIRHAMRSQDRPLLAVWALISPVADQATASIGASAGA